MKPKFNKTQKYKYDSAFYTSRGINEYLCHLGLDISNLRGKYVLDIGACYAKFQEDCEKYPDIIVISVDPIYAGKEKENKGKHESFPISTCSNSVFQQNTVDKETGDFFEIPENKKNKIAGINESLPFRDDTFDIALNLMSSFYYLRQNYPNYARRKKMAKHMFGEVLRVLKPNGKARIGDIRNYNPKLNDEIFYDPLLKEMKAEGKFDFDWHFGDSIIIRYLALNKGGCVK